MQPRLYHFQRVPWFRPFFGRRSTDERRAGSGERPVRGDEREQLLTGLLSKLPESQRLAFILCEVDGHSSEEIAGLMGVPVHTISSRIHKARARLAAKLEPLREGDERSVGR